jgi:SAM-dependent methyltransferase
MARTEDVRMPNSSQSLEQPQIGDEELLAIRRVFTAADYTAEALTKRLKLTDAPLAPVTRKDVPRYLYRLREGDPQAILSALFYVSALVRRDAFESAIGPTSAAAWEAAGLVRFEGENAVGLQRITPVDGLLLAIDSHWHSARTEDSSLRVMAFSGSTQLLSQLMILRPGTRVLDLGTGSGSLALLASAAASEVVGVDLNPYALERARFNARFNGVTNARWAVGDWFVPVEGERFDLIVANPPFVVSPESATLYRDSGRPLDSLCAELVGRVATYLTPGGFAQFLCNWVHRRGEDPRQRVAAWAKASGCDAWVLTMKVDDPADYAVTWLCQGDVPPADELNARFTTWMKHYEEAEIEAISFGLITLRKPAVADADRPTWFRAVDGAELTGPAGMDLIREFERTDFLESTDDARLLASQLRASRKFVWDQTVRPKTQGWDLSRSRLRRDSALAFVVDGSPALATLIASCRGDRPIGEVLAGLATRLGEDPARYAAENVATVRGMLELGFLEPADPPPGADD